MRKVVRALMLIVLVTSFKVAMVAQSDQLHRVIVVMKEQYNQAEMMKKTQFMDKKTARDFVVKEMHEFTESRQADIKSVVRNMKSFWIFNGFACEVTDDVIESLAQRDDVAFVYLDEPRRMIPEDDDYQPVLPMKGNAWNVTKVNADDVWTYYGSTGYTGAGVVVAVIDTGVNYNHTDITNNMWDGGSEFPHHGYDFVNEDDDPIDDQGHGTHCAGTVAGYGTNGTQTGMATGAKIMALKVLNDKGSGDDGDIVEAIQFAVEHGADILSMSLGASGVGGYWVYRYVMENVMATGIVAAVAAGNDHDEIDKYPVPYNVGAPGNCPPPYLHPDQADVLSGGISAVISIGATDQNDVKTVFSSIGPVTWSEGEYIGRYHDYPYTPESATEIGLIRPDVAAPGYQITSLTYNSNTGYTNKNGTSMATPCVAGVIALMLEANPNLTPAEIDMILETTAVRCEGATSKNNRTGSGRIDAYAAVQRVVTTYQDITVDGLNYTINKTTHEAQLTGRVVTAVDGCLNIPASVEYESTTYNVTALSKEAFANCTGINAIRLASEIPPAICYGTFGDIDKDTPVFVPCGKVDDYKNYALWSEFENIADSPHNLVVTINNEYGGEASVTQYASCTDDNSTVLAETNIGFSFDGWYVNNEKVSDELSYTFSHTEDVVFEAQFSRNANHFIANGTANTWNDPATWDSNTVPTSTSTVSIWKNITVDENAAVAQMGVYDGSTVTIASNKILTVAGNLETEDAQSIIIKNGAQLVHAVDGVKATVEKSIAAFTTDDNGWNLISFPLTGSGTIVSVDNMLSNEYDLYYYEEPTQKWKNQKKESNNFTTLEAGQGYLYANNTSIDMSFAGTVENGNATVTVPLSYTDGLKLSGFNLIGNPFVHNVTAYSVTNVEDGCFRINEAGTNLIVSTVSNANPLRPAEGFIVKATASGASVTFGSSAKANPDNRGSINLEIVQNDEVIDRFVVMKDATALKKISLEGEHTEIYAKDNGRKYAIMPLEGKEQTVCFKSTQMAMYTMDVKINNMELSYLHLIDNATGDDIDLLAEPSYTFYASSSDAMARFTLKFEGDETPWESDIFAYQNDNDIIINGEGTLQIFDLMGRMVTTCRVSGVERVAKPSQGVYIFKLNEKAQKIIIK